MQQVHDAFIIWGNSDTESMCSYFANKKNI